MTAAQLRAEAQGFLDRNWRLILGATLATLLFGLAFAFLSPQKFKSSAELLIDPRGLQIFKNEITRSSETTDGALVDIENQRYILLSRSILGAVVDREKLADNPAFGGAQPGMLSRLASSFGLARPKIDPRARAIQTLTSMVEVVRGDRAYILDVVVTSSDAALSAELANVIAGTFLDAQNEARSQIAGRASQELTKRADDLRRQVQAAESKVERYRAEHDLVQTATGRPLGEQQISDLSTQLGLVRARIADAQARVEAVDRFHKSGQNVEALTEALNSPTMASLRGQYAQAAQQAASLATQLGPRHPALVQAQEQVRDVRRLIGAELDRIAAAARSDLARARASEASLQQQTGKVRVVSDQNNEALVELRDLERAAETSRAVYQSYLSRAKEIGESQGVNSTNARVISQAIPALKPAGAPPALVLAGSLLFGLILGSGLAYARERLDDGIRSRRDLLELTDLPILAVIGTRAQPRGAGKGAKGGEDLVIDRAAMRNLFARLESDPDGNSIALVGAHDTSIMTQLIVGLAEFARWEDLDVAIVACAPESQPALAEVFDEQPGVRHGRGIVETVPLTAITRGRTLRQAHAAFDRLASGADLVLLDVPAPLEGVDASSALDLADRIVLVVQRRDLDRNRMRQLLDALADCEDRIAGVVVAGGLDQA